MASSSSQHHLQFTSLFSHGATSAPPPTPSSQQPDNNTNLSDQGIPAADTLSRLLQRQLTPNLSLPSRFRSHAKSTTTPNTASVDDNTSPPSFSLTDNSSTLLLTKSASEQGFFVLTDHGISSKLAESTESELIKSLFSLSRDRRRELFFNNINNWPVGFHEATEDEDEEEEDENLYRNAAAASSSSSFCLDRLTMSSSVSIPEQPASADDSQPLQLSCLEEMTLELERVGMEILEILGLIKEGKKEKLCSLMWVSEYAHDESSDESGSVENRNNWFNYPYVVALEYQVHRDSRRRKYCLETDTGSVFVTPPIDSVLVTLGDIAQVWSNGKIKKVRGRPIPVNIKNTTADLEDTIDTASNLISMTLLITLPLESTVSVSPLHPNPTSHITSIEEEEEEEDQSTVAAVFRSFSFEDYAWRVYHDNQRRLMSFKDPLERYRIHPED